MSAIAGVFSARPRPDLSGRLPALLHAMPHRGTGPDARADVAGASLGVRRFDWEQPNHLAGPLSVARQGDVTVVTDASIYYRDDLRRSLASRGVTPASEAPADLVLAAWLAFGAGCVRVLEGDFAFLLHDGRDGRVLLARDHVGRRPLHWALHDGVLVAASTARAIAAAPGVTTALNLPAVAAALGGLLGGSTETGFVGVHPVPAGAALEWTGSGAPREVASWQPPEFRIGGRADLEGGARQLRELLVRAVGERLAPGTSIWLSGGADSTAVFGAAQVALEGHPGARVTPVTVSYPEGDSAREDHHVQAIADRWSAPVHWIDSEEVRILDDAEVRAAVRDDPYAHTFEHMNRRMARASVATGAHVVFDGYGGDQLFHVSEVYFADLFVRLRWRELQAARRVAGSAGVRDFLVDCVVPWLPPGLYRSIQRLRGRSPHTLDAQSLPGWLTPTWREAALLRSRSELEPPRRLFESPAGYESRWYTQTPYFPRAVSWSGGVALEGGVDVRSPLMDRRIMEFATSRPVTERALPGETKCVLRAAVRGLIPDSVLAPRKSKTGVPRAYLHRRLRDELPGAAARIFGGESPVLLEEFGLIDRAAYLREVKRYLDAGEHLTGVQLLLTLQSELWMRSVATGSGDGRKF